MLPVGCVLVRVAVVQVRIVRMRVHHRLMAVSVHVRSGSVPVGHMRMPVMRVVQVLVFVLQRFVRMLVHMAFRQVQPDPERH